MDGMEVIAIAVVVSLFVFVLKQFGICESSSSEGKIQNKAKKQGK